jgi:hypothetical protein
VVQRHVLYLGEINGSQRAAWCRSIEVFDEDRTAAAQMALFPEGRPAPELACAVVQVKLSQLRLRHARQWGACWLACTLWDLLELDAFWQPRLPPSRKGTRWLSVLKILADYGLIDPGSDHQLDTRIEAHSFVAFLADCLQVTLKARLRPLAPGLTPRSALEKFAAIQMVDVHLPTTDGRTLILSRYTEPEPDQQILLDRLRLRLPEQPPPRIASTLHAEIA